MELTVMEFVERNLFLTAIFAGLVVAIIVFEFRVLTRRHKELTPADAVALMNREEPIVLDVREDNEVGKGLIGQARHIPATMFDKRASEIDERDKEKPMLIYCASGVRSQGICRKLTGRGFTKVYNLKGGLAAWEQAGLPTQQDGK